jgi:hypothetical protein
MEKTGREPVLPASFSSEASNFNHLPLIFANPSPDNDINRPMLQVRPLLFRASNVISS